MFSILNTTPEWEIPSPSMCKIVPNCGLAVAGPPCGRPGLPVSHRKYRIYNCVLQLNWPSDCVSRSTAY
jgi:hypothetical protein